MNELNDLVMRFEEDGDGSVPMIDEEDPDWDESVERKKIRQQQMRTKKRGFGKSMTISHHFHGLSTHHFLSHPHPFTLLCLIIHVILVGIPVA